MLIIRDPHQPCRSCISLSLSPNLKIIIRVRLRSVRTELDMTLAKVEIGKTASGVGENPIFAPCNAWRPGSTRNQVQCATTQRENLTPKTRHSNPDNSTPYRLQPSNNWHRKARIDVDRFPSIDIDLLLRDSSHRASS